VRDVLLDLALLRNAIVHNSGQDRESGPSDSACICSPVARPEVFGNLTVTVHDYVFLYWEARSVLVPNQNDIGLGPPSRKLWLDHVTLEPKLTGYYVAATGTYVPNPCGDDRQFPGQHVVLQRYGSAHSDSQVW